jgi:hypothetical protein
VTRTCIIISPYFPPSTLAGVHRARHLVKYLPGAGWTPVVVCVDEAYQEERLDPGLAELVPTCVEVVRVPAVSPQVCRPFGLGEISLRAWRPLRNAVLRLLATRPIGVVLITGSPYYPMLLAKLIKQRFGVPVVLDFQDPWVSAWGATQPRWSKSGASHQLSVMLEPRAVRSADFITSVSETQNVEMRARYPWLDCVRMAAIPIGGDPEDYEVVRRMELPTGSFELDPSRVNLTYVGTIWPPVLETVRTLLRAAARVRVSRPDVYARLSLNFIGTTRNPDTPDGRWVRPLAEAQGIADIVREVPERVPYLEALALQARSDGTLVLGSLEPHYTASKIYSVLMSGRPYLSLFHARSSSHDLLSRAGGGIALGFEDSKTLRALAVPLADAIEHLATVPASFRPVAPAAYESFTAPRIAARFGEIFDRLSEAHRQAAAFARSANRS